MYLKKLNIFIFILFVFVSSLFSQEFMKSATSKPILVQDGNSKYWCPVCGNDLIRYYRTNHISNLKNGTKRQYCSLHCLVVDMNNYGIDLDSTKVIDAKTQKVIDANSAYYVVKSRISGTMSKVSKLAFQSKKDADDFIKIYRGKIVDFNTALQMAQETLKSDNRIQKKLKIKKLYKIGKRIFENVCDQNIDTDDYLEINELKGDIVNERLCKPLNSKQLHALALYLWEGKNLANSDIEQNKVVVTTDEKCPVCGMFTYKYPKWAAQIFYKHDNHEHHYSFDGVKDMMKFYFNPMAWGDYKNSVKKNISKILVTDYYSQKAIDATKAYYVIGSDIYGPMGNELIPFENKDDAKTFKSDHRGTNIIEFKDIIEDEVYKLDTGQ